jgi:hypothetical protein
MSTPVLPHDPPLSPPVRTYRNNWWRVLGRTLLCFMAGAMISTSLVGIRGYEVAYRLNSRPGHIAHSVGTRLVLEKLESEPISPAEELEYMKEAFARQLQGMTWTWDNELKPGQP